MSDHPNTIQSKHSVLPALIGFGEAGKAFASGWRGVNPGIKIRAFDIKTNNSEPAIAGKKNREYEAANVDGCASCEEAIRDSNMIFSLVTAGQALIAAQTAAQYIAKNTLYLDCNSCAPDTKKQAMDVISKAGGRYVDVAVMGPVGPDLNKIPLVICGQHAVEAKYRLEALAMNVTHLPGDVGRASSIKMIRSVMMKGLEALALECVLSARLAGVEDEVLQSLDITYPGFDWQSRSTHMLERVMTHGIRRAEEMREVALSVSQLGLPDDMARATVAWHQRIGELQISATDGDFRDHADQILAHIDRSAK